MSSRPRQREAPPDAAANGPSGDEHAVSAASGRPPLVIIDRRQLIRECLVGGLSGCECEVVGFASIEAWRSAQLREPAGSTIVLHYGSAEDRRRLVHEELPQLEIPIQLVLVSDTEEIDEIVEFINGGAKAYVPAHTALGVLREIIRLVSAGGSFVPSSALLAGPQGRVVHPVERASQFTSRQEAVLKAIQMGKPNKIIAYELNMMESTVKVHVRNIMKKIGAKNRTELAVRTFNPDFQRLKLDPGHERALPRG